MSVRLYVGNLSKEMQRQELESVFSEYTEDLVSVKLISDKKTGKCRGFGFVTVKTDEKADEIVEKFNGHVLDESPLKVEKAMPRAKSKSEDGEAGSETAAPARRRGKSNGRSVATSTGGASAAAQPDPRWAGELEKLKQLLGTQQTPTA